MTFSTVAYGLSFCLGFGVAFLVLGHWTIRLRTDLLLRQRELCSALSQSRLQLFRATLLLSEAARSDKTTTQASWRARVFELTRPDPYVIVDAKGRFWRVDDGDWCDYLEQATWYNGPEIEATALPPGGSWRTLQQALQEQQLRQTMREAYRA